MVSCKALEVYCALKFVVSCKALEVYCGLKYAASCRELDELTQEITASACAWKRDL